MNRTSSTWIAFTCYLLVSNGAYSQTLQPMSHSVEMPEQILAPEDVSAVERLGRFLVIGADEGVGEGGKKSYIQLLTKRDNRAYELHSDILLLEGGKKRGKEMDIEALAVEGDVLYVLGSHSSKRKRVKKSKKYKKNRKAFRAAKIKDERNRDWLFRLTIDAQGKETARERISLRNLIADDPVLKPFQQLPGKENGVDIEGLSVRDNWLYIGFRGPVLRGNYVPVMRLKFDNPENSYELLYLELGGRGIRAMASVTDGHLVVAGPVGDGPASYRLYHWDGKDLLPGRDRSRSERGNLRLLGEIIPPEQGKAEGLVVLQEEDNTYHLAIAFDGVTDKDNILKYYRLDKPE